MSCSNLNNGIAKGCNNIVGGVTGLHYRRLADTQLNVDANGVVVGETPYQSQVWYYIQLERGTASLTETIEKQGDSSLVFVQTFEFFMPDKMQKGDVNPPDSLHTFVDELASDNQLEFIIETNDITSFNSNRNSYWMGHERGAYLATATRTTGTQYTDKGGWTFTVEARSKVPMHIVDYMFFHISSVSDIYPLVNNTAPPDEPLPANGFSWNFLPLARYMGAQLFAIPQPPTPSTFYPEFKAPFYSQVTMKGIVTAIWTPDCFSGGQFAPRFYAKTNPSFVATVDATYISAPTAYTGNPEAVEFEYTINLGYDYTVAANGYMRLRPLDIDIPGLPNGTLLTETGFQPYLKLLELAITS